MNIWESNKLILVIAFVIPGFVSLKTYSLLFPSEPKDSGKQIIDAVAYSCVNYALLLPLIYCIDSFRLWESHPAVFMVLWIFILLIAPVFWAWLYKKIRQTELLRRTIPHPTGKPWDYIFGKNTPYWIIVSLSDGTKIAGRYDTESFASSAPEPGTLYLEETWWLNEDGGFDRPRANTAGILILSEDVVSIEFFKLSDGDHDDRSQETRRGPPANQEGASTRAADASDGE